MTDIRKVCKVFLDFVYEQGVLPPDINSVLDDRRYQNFKWDIRQICYILKEQEAYGEKEAESVHSKDRESLFKSEIHNKRGCWRHKTYDQDISEWISDCSSLLGSITQQLNIFFHNVNTDVGTKTLIAAIKEIIDHAPEKMEKNKYLNEIRKYDGDLQAPRPGTSHVQGTCSNTKKALDFKNYLAERGYKPAVQNSYKTAVNTWGSKILEKDLWSIDSPTEMQKRFDVYCNTPQFTDKNVSTHGTLSNGLKRYIEFLEERFDPLAL